MVTHQRADISYSLKNYMKKPNIIKSTLTNLLSLFSDDSDSDIFVDGAVPKVKKCRCLMI